MFYILYLHYYSNASLYLRDSLLSTCWLSSSERSWHGSKDSTTESTEHLLGSNFLPDIEQSWEPQGPILRLHIKNTNRKYNRINRLLATLHLICTLR